MIFCHTSDYSKFNNYFANHMVSCERYRFKSKGQDIKNE